MSKRGCNGDCCRAFMLGFSPQELGHAYVRWLEGESTLESGRPVPRDIHLIAPMVRYIGQLDADPITKVAWPTPQHVYSCIHLGESGDCQIYPMRPAMCRDYPSDNVCNYSCGYEHTEDELIQIRLKNLPPDVVEAIKAGEA